MTPVPSDTLDWHWYGKTITLNSNTVSVRIKNELWVSAAKDGSNLGYFDDIAIYDGSCPVEPPKRLIEVSIDIKSGSYPNSFNNNEKGVIPVALLGSTDFNP